MYDKPELCSNCGGYCCKSLPGIVFPSDLPEVTRESLEHLLYSNRYAIDWWDGDARLGKQRTQPLMSRVLFVRPALKGKEGRIFDPAWGGTDCTFLTSKGCQLESEKRPSGCKLLEPKKLGCRYHGKMNDSKREGALTWLKYQNLLEEFEGE